MNLQEQIKEDIKQAMRDKDLQVLDTLRMLSSSLKNKAIELRTELADADVVSIIRGDVKKLQEAAKEFVTGARADLAEQYEKEIVILKRYLPAEMSQEELEARIEKILGEKTTEDLKDVGRAMGVVMGDLKGLVDGARVRETVQIVLKKINPTT